MSADFASTHIQRGLHLARVRRFPEAEAAFKDALSGDPENGFALYQLAFIQWQQDGRERDALKTALQAVRVAPNNSDHHALKALITANVHNVDFAMPAAEEAIRLDPTSAYAWFVRAHLHLNARRLAKAEADARAALECDPQHNGAANVLSHALRMQGRTAENAAQIAGMLERDPEDDDNHAAAGWNALQAGKYAEAQTHFREAMRLNPESEFAREGLIEAFRARSLIYRLHLRWSLWMRSKSSTFQWGVILGLCLLAGSARTIFSGSMAPLAALLIGFYFVFALWAHVARGMGNFVLLCDRFARTALRRMEKWEACTVGGAISVGVILGSLGAILVNFPLLIIAGTLVAASIPFAHTFTNQSSAGQRLFGFIGVFTLCAGAIFVCSPWLEPWIPARTALRIGLTGLVASLGSTWLSNLPGLSR